MSELWLIERCEHGHPTKHWLDPYWQEHCPGGTTTRIEPDYEAAAKVYFYEVGRRSGSTLKFETAYDSEQADFIEVATRAVDAALGGNE